jgi:1-pyrroline-5-carboxylate dehydrogenase
MPLSAFQNEALTDFSDPKNRAAMEAALAKVKSELGRDYPLRIGGEKISTTDKLKSVNPSRPSEVVGSFSKADTALAEKAMLAAVAAFESSSTGWSRTSAAERVAMVVRAAGIMRQRKHELSAWMVHEVGKTWAEADADTAEAIDFAEYYARHAEALFGGSPQSRVTPIAGEKNEMRYIPLGVGVVIPPWNFPLAIATGMTIASIVCGNTVVLKPSSDSPTLAYKMCEILEEAGVPAGVVNFCPGSGAAIGDYLVMHPKTRFVAFTGSKEVGLRINELAAKPVKGCIWIKRVVAEMGGKDAMVIDKVADLDRAVEAVTVAAFGYQGQKCSACSRAIVVDSVYDEFLGKLKARVEKIKVGASDDPGVYMGPVINAAAFQTISGYIEAGKKEGKLLTGGDRAAADGYFLQPTVIAGVPADGKLAQEEIFGPVLAVIRAQDFDQALAFANNTEFGLTGGVFSDDPARLKKASESFHVGNLYLNRKCTGAFVGGHPFGGFNMSGTDSKAGGPDYLLLFTQAKTISEKM